MKNQNLLIRKAVLQDAPVIADFNVKMALETENKKLNFQSVLQATEIVINSDNKGFYIVAIMDNKIVGSLLITYEWSDWRNGDFWWIQSVYVMPEYRKRGIFKDLYNFVKNLAKDNSQKVCGLRLYVDKENLIAQNVYKSLGMVETNYLLMEEEF